ncbi:Efflux pump bik6 [Penicillium chermesinum]|nr:Efflux pump bik6 [Penicillium chermesinum]
MFSQRYLPVRIPIADSIAPQPPLSKTHEEAKSMVSEKDIESPAGKTVDPKQKGDLVEFDGPDDPYMPLNWPFRKKILTTICYGLTTCWITFASAVYSAGISAIGEDFNVGSEVTATGISLVLFGFAAGPLLWAPLGEVYGRKWTVLVPYFIAGVFSFGTATAKDIQTVLITRFFTGFFGSAPVTSTGGVMADIWRPQQRGIAIVAYAITLVVGPTMAPIVGSAVTSSYLGWRWTEYLSGIVMVSQFVLDALVLEESYAPLYSHTRPGDYDLKPKIGPYTPRQQEELDISVKELAHKYLIRPFQMLATPICLLMSIYASFVYAILYANLESVPIEYQQVRGWSPVVASLPFIALLIGIFCAAAINIYNNDYYFKQFRANGNKPVPEARLPPMMVGSFAFTAGLFIFAWTSSPHINYWPSIIGMALIGLGFTTIFQSALNYLIDTFTRFSASAVAANTFLRSGMAGAFPLFVVPMYRSIGVDWGVTIFGAISAVLIPVPFMFFFWGKQIRGRGQWSKLSL